MWRDQSSLMDG